MNEMSEDHDDCADLEWVPPTEAEQKIINARRERSNKISKLMGDYLLKGKIEKMDLDFWSPNVLYKLKYFTNVRTFHNTNLVFHSLL